MFAVAQDFLLGEFFELRADGLARETGEICHVLLREWQRYLDSVTRDMSSETQRKIMQRRDDLVERLGMFERVKPQLCVRRAFYLAVEQLQHGFAIVTKMGNKFSFGNAIQLGIGDCFVIILGAPDLVEHPGYWKDVEIAIELDRLFFAFGGEIIAFYKPALYKERTGRFRILMQDNIASCELFYWVRC